MQENTFKHKIVLNYYILKTQILIFFSQNFARTMSRKKKISKGKSILPVAAESWESVDAGAGGKTQGEINVKTFIP